MGLRRRNRWKDAGSGQADGMSAEQTLPTLDPSHALRPSLIAPAPQRQPVFWLALAGAALAHAALVVGLSGSGPHRLGDAGGRVDAINVELVDEGELRGMSAAPTPAETPPTPPAPAAQPAAPAAEPPRPQAEPTPETASPQQSAALPTLEAEEPQASPPPDVLPKPSPPKAGEASESTPTKESPTKPTPKNVPKPPAPLDLSVPFDLTMQGATSGASSATRPPGITRSGENDRFGRDVIRALKKTMPPLESVTGKVTIRIFLDERGNIAWVRLVNGSGDRGLDDGVVFSAHQASFPFPPKGASVADRTFLVTYVYRR
jgi:TonB family protein